MMTSKLSYKIRIGNPVRRIALKYPIASFAKQIKRRLRMRVYKGQEHGKALYLIH